MGSWQEGLLFLFVVDCIPTWEAPSFQESKKDDASVGHRAQASLLGHAAPYSIKLCVGICLCVCLDTAFVLQCNPT